jgi:hypothetical protein
MYMYIHVNVHVYTCKCTCIYMFKLMYTYFIVTSGSYRSASEGACVPQYTQETQLHMHSMLIPSVSFINDLLSYRHVVKC